MKLNKQIPSFAIHLNYKMNKWKLSKCLPYQKKIWNPLELDENMQLDNSSIVLKTCVPEFLKRPSSMLTFYIFLTSLWCKNKNKSCKNN